MTRAQRPRKFRSLQGRGGTRRGRQAARDRRGRRRGVGGPGLDGARRRDAPRKPQRAATWEEAAKGPCWALFAKHASHAARSFLT